MLLALQSLLSAVQEMPDVLPKRCLKFGLCEGPIEGILHLLHVKLSISARVHKLDQ